MITEIGNVTLGLLAVAALAAIAVAAARRAIVHCPGAHIGRDIMNRRKIRVLLIPEQVEGRTHWTAQGLDIDIVAAGKSLEAAVDAFGYTVMGQFMLDVLRGREPLSQHEPAPMADWEMFAKARQLPEPEPVVTDEAIPPAFVVQALLPRTDARVLD